MINAELALTTLAAMLSPTTLSFSLLALLLGDKPRRKKERHSNGATPRLYRERPRERPV